jgi:hypothetical protein
MGADMSGNPPYPTELILRDQWCLWRIEPTKNGGPTKVPYRPDGRKAASNDPRTWSTFAEVCAAHARDPSLYGGVGYFFSADDPVCGVDLDVSLDANGNPQPWAAEIIARFRSTYQALSVSGLGLHILCRATLPGKGRNFYVPGGPSDPDGKRAQIGVFDRGRFFALTGRLHQESPLEVADHQEEIDWLLSLIQGRLRKPAAPKPVAGELDDAEIVERARRAKNGAKFAGLWAGNWEGTYGSQSEADLALCCMLAFWCGPDPSRISTLFRQSGLAREKWLEREDYRERTVQAAIEQTREFYKPKKRRAPPTGMRTAPASPTTGVLREVWIGARQLHEMSGEVLAALQAANEPPELFARSGRMVGVVRDERQRHVIAEITEAALRGRMARSAFYYKLNKDQERVECIPPLDVVRDILALSPVEWRFPPLEALIESPFLRSDGTICGSPGYDASTCLFYAPAPGLRLPKIPEIPTRDHVDVSLDLLDSAIGDFPFANEASRANAIASILTPVVRPAINSPTPLALYDAPQAGTGKTLLAEVVAIISTGRAAETFSAPNDPEEWRKKITTALSTGTTMVVIDNVVRRLDSDALCMALTATTISDRQFRTFDRIVLPVKCAWIATGNNIQLGGDMPRRCYWIRLDAKESQPFRRTGFQHADLRAWVRDHRGELIVALLTIARYWYLQGRPEPKAVRPLGSFEAWCKVVGGMLEVAGVEGFLANADAMFEQADSEAVQWESFLLTLAELFDGEPFRVTDVVQRLEAHALLGGNAESKGLREALPDFLAEAGDRTGGFFQRRLARCFAERAGRRFGESQVFLERADADLKAKVLRWRVVKL